MIFQERNLFQKHSGHAAPVRRPDQRAQTHTLILMMVVVLPVAIVVTSCPRVLDGASLRGAAAQT